MTAKLPQFSFAVGTIEAQIRRPNIEKLALNILVELS